MTLHPTQSFGPPWGTELPSILQSVARALAREGYAPDEIGLQMTLLGIQILYDGDCTDALDALETDITRLRRSTPE
jgi:hypothetical protein